MVVPTTSDGRIARFVGIPSEGLQAALRQKGAAVEQQNEVVDS
jgi:hypothetical protein